MAEEAGSRLRSTRQGLALMPLMAMLKLRRPRQGIMACSLFLNRKIPIHAEPKHIPDAATQ
jgi:hypothetical protein